MSKDVVILGAPLVEGIQYSKLIYIDSCWTYSLTEIKWIYKKFFILVTRIRDLWLIVKGIYISSYLFSMERGMDSFCFFNLRARTAYYLLITVGALYRMRTKVLDEPEINQSTNSQGALLQGTNVIAYDSSDLAAATNNFLLANKIGHGGFGNVYKGVLENGVEIAVKKQDVTSRQGFTEFENEFKLIAKLQHRNLTKLLGYCINGAEKFLVYEFMANNSLDKVIFDPARRGTVTWPIHIVAGNKW